MFITDLIEVLGCIKWLCGQHKTESYGWRSIMLTFDTSSSSTIEFAFEYYLQNNEQEDPTVYYLVDDLVVLGNKS